MFQYKEKEIKGLNISKLMPAPHKEDHDNYLERYISTGEAKIIGKEREVNGVRKDGSNFPARLMVSEVRTEKNWLFVGLMSDLTEKKKAERRLKSQSAALKSAANGIVITNTKGEIEWVNPAFSKLTGYTWKEVVGKNPRVLNSGKHDINYFKNLWDTIINGNIWHDEVINKKKNGDLYYEEMTITPILNDKGEIVQFVAIKQDITERKKYEEIMVKANKRMEDELNVAKEIQMSMLHLIFPAYPERKEFDVFSSLVPAREVGGDFYDFFFIDEDRFCICVGDVSGKGVPAALFMAVTKTLIKSRASDDISTASILTHVNDELSRDNTASMFVTIFAAILNIKTGEFIYTNAGHNPPYIIQNSGNLLRLDTLHGPVAGAMPGMTYKQDSYTMKPGECCVMFTDGVTEAMNIKGELYSEPRLQTLFSENTFKSVNQIVSSIVDSVSSFENEAEQADDITVMAIKYNGFALDTSRCQVVIKNDLVEIKTVTEAFEEFTKVNGIAEKMSKQFMIAIDELLNNVIHYGYPKDKENEIHINFELSKTMLSLTFIDEGIPFNPFQKTQPDTTLSIEDRPIGGLGIHLIKNMMDNVEYQRHINKNVVKITKYLTNPVS
jgi:sigma-B regulation protein RsbU (phosphoserine phosphatase)